MEEQNKAQRREEYRRQGYWGDATLLHCWQAAVLRWPAKTAVVDCHGTSLSFSQADHMAGRLAAWMRGKGIVAGDVISLQLPGWAEFLPVYIACLKLGAVVNPIPTNLRQQETGYILSLCQSRLLFSPCCYKKFFHADMCRTLQAQQPQLLDVVYVDKFLHCPDGLTLLHHIMEQHAPLPLEELCFSPVCSENEAGADALAAILFTSGSEGNPKGVMLSHNNIIFSESTFAAHHGISQFDVMLMPAPVTHATGFHHGVTMPFLVGATTVLQDIFVARTSLKLIEEQRCTVTMAASPFVFDIMKELHQSPADISSLRAFLCGGTPVPPHMVQEAEEQFGLRIHNVYGSTESVPHVGIKEGHSQDKKQHTAGRPMPGVEVRVTDKQRQPLPAGCEGEEASRGPQIFMGYLKHPAMTAAAVDSDGWYYSGDLCVMDEEGFVRICGRIKDIIIRGGENISSLEVEKILLRHPAIEEVAVVGMPDPRLSERICAYVMLKDAGQGLTFADMLAFLSEQLIAKQKFPERLEIVQELPRTASGKVRKNVLREDIAHKIQNEGL